MPKSKIINSAGITAVVGLAILPVFLTFSPLFTVGTDAAHAEGAAETLSTSAEVMPTLGLSANSISMRISPSSSGSVFKTGKTIATVSTNNATGYTLYLSDNDGDNALKHQDVAGASINSISAILTGTNMASNTWGYTLGDSVVEEEGETNNSTNLALDYSPIPTDRTIIHTRSNNTPDEGEPTAITFGVKVGVSIPSGAYSDQVAITAIPNYSPATYPASTLWLNSEGVRISTLQEMTPDVCARVPIPAITATGANVPEIILTDTRDGNEYKVRKLADGNCWMVESLKFNGKTAEPVLSNVSTSFSVPAAVAVGSTANNNAVAYVSNDGVNSTYLYNWYAATAGSGTAAVTSGNASQDICPRGWHLPNNDGNASWQKLLHVGQGVYEIATSSNGYNSSVVSWGTYAGISTAASNPVGLQLTGYFYGGSLDGTGNGDYWSRTASSADSAYHLGYYSSNVYPQGDDNKVHGFGVRCVSE